MSPKCDLPPLLYGLLGTLCAKACLTGRPSQGSNRSSHSRPLLCHPSELLALETWQRILQRLAFLQSNFPILVILKLSCHVRDNAISDVPSALAILVMFTRAIYGFLAPHLRYRFDVFPQVPPAYRSQTARHGAVPTGSSYLTMFYLPRLAQQPQTSLGCC
jgi:hypothetical protein